MVTHLNGRQSGGMEKRNYNRGISTRMSGCTTYNGNVTSCTRWSDYFATYTPLFWDLGGGGGELNHIIQENYIPTTI